MKVRKTPKPTSANAAWHLRQMGHIVARHNANISKSLQDLGLTAPLWRILNGLHETPESSIGDLAEHSAFERSYTGRLIDRLEALGLVSVTADPEDKRARVVRLTPTGHSTHAIAFERVSALNLHAISSLDAVGQEQLHRLLDAVARRIGAEIKLPASVAY